VPAVRGMSDERFYHRDSVQQARLSTQLALESAPRQGPCGSVRPLQALDGRGHLLDRNIRPVRQRGGNDRLNFAFGFHNRFEVIPTLDSAFHADTIVSDRDHIDGTRRVYHIAVLLHGHGRRGILGMCDNRHSPTGST
jgi:hypothetical protein